MGKLDPADNGNFELTVPDFTRDPMFNANSSDFGFLILSLEDERVGSEIAVIAPTESHNDLHGLEIEADYPDPVVFTAIH